jgi:hypothetical protein
LVLAGTTGVGIIGMEIIGVGTTGTETTGDIQIITTTECTPTTQAEEGLYT